MTKKKKIDTLHEKFIDLTGWAIEGAGGKGGGSGATEAANTLRSDSTVRVQEVISEGPIKGLHTGDAQSIFFNNTPLKNADGSTNYYNFSWDFRSGLPSQAAMAGFPDIENTNAVGVIITAEIPAVRTVSSAAIDSVRVTLNFPNGLFTTDSTNGNINGNSVTYAIDTKLTAGSNWTTVANLSKSGKTMSAYEWDVLIPRPPGTSTQWDLRVRRTQADETVSTSVNTIQWAAYTEIQNITETYPNTAYIGIAVDAQSTNNTVPTRSYLVDGLLIQYPTNYTPGYYGLSNTWINPSYSGTWNGTFTTGYCNNPAWVLYDLLTNVRYGLGEWITEEDIDIYSFYAAAVYNDTLVDNMAGGQEPLYQFNNVINAQDDALKILTAVAGSMAATITIQGGLVKLCQDRPGSPVKLVTKDNVKDGAFTYSSTNLQTRYTACDVIWNDPSLNYLQNTAHFESTGNAGIIAELGSDQIATFGYNSNQIAGYGCTTLGQAHRLALYQVYTSLVQKELAAWTSSYNQMDLEVGDIVTLYDEDYAQQSGAGKIISISGDNITLDRPVVLNGSNSITFVDADGYTLTTLSISQTNTTTNAITVASAPNAGAVGHDYVITSAISARQFRILSIKASTEANSVDITACQYDPNKYLFVTGQALQPTGQYSAQLYGTLSTPTGVTFIPQQVNDPVAGTYANLFVTWDSQNNQNGFFQYQASWRKDNGNWSTIIYTNVNSFTIDHATQGTYEIQLKAVNLAGISSPSAVTDYVFGYAGTNTLLPPSGGITLQSGHGTGTVWSGNDLYIQWTPNANNVGMLNQTVGGYHIQILNNDLGTVLGNYTVDANTTTFAYMYADNVLQSKALSTGPCRHIMVKIWTMDAFGNNSSSDIQQVFTHPAPNAPILTLTADGNGGAFVDFSSTDTNTSDIQGYKCWYGSANTVSYTTGTETDLTVSQVGANFGSNVSSVGPATVDVALPLPQNADGSLYGATFYFVGTAYDSFSDDPRGLNISTAYSINVGPTFVSAAQLVAGAVTASKLAAGAVGAAALNIPAIDSNGHLAANSVGNSQIASGAVSANQTNIAAIVASTGNLASNSVGTAQIVAGSVTTNSIAAGTITANNIASGTITASLIAAGTITGSNIAANTITGGNILAGTITADKLLVGDLTNQVTNGQFTSSTLTGWVLHSGSGTWSLDTTSKGVGGTTNALKFVGPGGTTAGISIYKNTQVLTVNQNDIYSVILQANPTVTETKTVVTPVLIATSTTGVVTVVLPTTQYLVGGTIPTGLAANATSTTGYNQLSWQYTVPATTASIQAAVQVAYNQGGATSTATVYIDNVQLMRVSGATLIQPGSITTGQIAAGTIIGNNIAAGTITGSNIQAGTISAGNLNTTSAIITGTAQIANGVIVDAHIQNLNGSKITSNSITSTQIAANSISAAQIAANSITADRLSVSTLSAITGNVGTLTSGTINSVTINSSTINSTVMIGATIEGTTILGGNFTGYAWPPSGQKGYYLGPSGLLLGNPNTGTYFQYDYGSNGIYTNASIQATSVTANAIQTSMINQNAACSGNVGRGVHGNGAFVYGCSPGDRIIYTITVDSFYAQYNGQNNNPGNWVRGQIYNSAYQQITTQTFSMSAQYQDIYDQNSGQYSTSFINSPTCTITYMWPCDRSDNILITWDSSISQWWGVNATVVVYVLKKAS